MEQLQECPFCGAKAELISNDETTYGFPTPKWAVRCEIETCIAHDILPNYSQHEDAIKDWNTRADKWISVEERLPKRGAEVLICATNKFGNNEQEQLILQAYYEEYFREKGWYKPTTYREETNCINNLFTHVSHWMPLPNPTKMKGGN